MLWLLVNGLWCSQTSAAHIGGLKEPEHVIYIVKNVDFFFLISWTVTLDRPRLVNVHQSSLMLPVSEHFTAVYILQFLFN